MLERRNSPIHGYGLFATQPIGVNLLLINWMKGSEILGEYSYDPNNQTSIRLFGNLSIDGDKDDTDYINHSDDPNCIFLFGMVFSQRPIAIDEEMTLDYRYILPPDDVNVVRGHPASVAIAHQIDYISKNWQDMKVT